MATFTGYMELAVNLFAARKQKLRVLDLPAGNGLLADALRGMGLRFRVCLSIVEFIRVHPRLSAAKLLCFFKRSEELA